MKRHEFVLVIALLVFGLVHHAVKVGRTEFARGIRWNSSDLLSEQYRDFPQPAVSFAGIDQIDVDNPAGSVEVTPSADGQTTLKATIRVHGDDPAQAQPIARLLKVDSQRQGSRLTIAIADKDRFPMRRARIILSLQVPPTVALDIRNRFGRADIGTGRALTLDEKYGDCRVEGIAGPLTLDQGYGTLRVARIEGKGQIETKYSNVDIQDLGELFFSGKYATVSIQRVKGLAQITQAYGPLTLDTARQAEIEAKHAKILLRNVPEGVRLSDSYKGVDLESCGGAIQLTGKYCRMKLSDIAADSLVIENAYHPVSVERFSGKSIDIVLRNGDLNLKVLRVDERITVDAQHADVTLEYPAGTNPSLSLTTRHGDILNQTRRSFGTTSERSETEVSVPGGKPDITLKTVYGDIVLNETLLEKAD